jgi:hypothetical protein
MTVLSSLANVKFGGRVERPARCMADTEDQNLVFCDPIEHDIGVVKHRQPTMPSIIDEAPEPRKMTQ